MCLAFRLHFCNETRPNVTAFSTEDDDDDNISQGKGLTVD